MSWTDFTVFGRSSSRLTLNEIGHPWSQKLSKSYSVDEIILPFVSLPTSICGSRRHPDQRLRRTRVEEGQWYLSVKRLEAQRSRLKRALLHSRHRAQQLRLLPDGQHSL